MTNERTVVKRQEQNSRRTPDKPLQSDSAAPNLSETPDISRMSQGDILALQRQIGNQAVMRLLKQQSPAQESAQRLPNQLGGALGKAFGSDFSDVHVHTDASANQIARAADSDATTIGQDIYFREGAFNPGTAKGNALIAREIAHIEQGRNSSEASAAERSDADNVGGIVETMGANPSEVLQRAHKEPTRLQQQVLQRVGGKGDAKEGKVSGMRNLGILTSKVTQGVFTTILGPLSLLWRWPLIQKNIGEAMGDKHGVGTWTAKASDNDRYGDGKWGAAMRWLTVITEILKELLIWCGFATLISAVVAGATHGALTPVFLVLAIVTAAIGGTLALLKLGMAGFNFVRLYILQENKGDAVKRSHMKAQMFNDLFDGVSAVITTVFAALGAGGVTATVGGAVSHDMGLTGGTSKGVSAGINMATQGIATSITNNAAKEWSKEAAKPGKEHGFTGGEGFTLKDKKTEDWGGFGKDALVIKNAYKGVPGWWDKKFGKKGGQDAGNVIPPLDNAQGNPTPVVDPDQAQVMALVDALPGKSASLVQEENVDLRQAVKANDKLNDSTPSLGQATAAVKATTADVGNLEQASKAASKTIDTTYDNMDPNAGDALDKDVKNLNAALAQVGQKPVNDTDEEKVDEPQTDVTGENKVLQPMRSDIARAPGIFSRIGGWFARKVQSAKKAAHRLNNWILKSVLGFAAKLNKSDADPNSLPAALSEAAAMLPDTVATEQKTAVTAENIHSDAVKIKAGVDQLAEQEGQ